MSTATFHAERLVLGEGPVWDWRVETLLWVDIIAGLILTRGADGSVTTTAVGEQIGSLALTEDPSVVIAALRSGWHRVSLATGDATPIAAPEQDRPGMRFNDGAVDARGRFWTGTLHDSEAIPAGRLHRLDPDGSFATPDAGFLCSNGIDWSPDDRWMYFVDSRRQAIYRYPFDVDAGSLGPRELWVDTSAWDGIPDGLAVDADGLIWCAFWDGAAVHAFAADGTHVRSLEVPVRRPTSVAFGGADLRTLYLTSASKDLSDDALARWPESGKTLALPDIAEGRAAGVYGQRTR